VFRDVACLLSQVGEQLDTLSHWESDSSRTIQSPLPIWSGGYPKFIIPRTVVGATYRDRAS
jgi:hypothetical protein